MGAGKSTRYRLTESYQIDQIGTEPLVATNSEHHVRSGGVSLVGSDFSCMTRKIRVGEPTS